MAASATLNIFLSATVNLEAAIHSNLSKSRKLSRGISAVEFPYTWNHCLSIIHSNFTYRSETYDCETSFIIFVYTKLQKSKD